MKTRICKKMKLNLTIDFTFDTLKKELPKLMKERINRDIEFVKNEIDKGIDKSISPVTGQPFKPISEVTSRVRNLRRKNRKAKDKPLVSTGKMSKLKVKKAKQQGEGKFYGYIQMGAPYGVFHLKPQTIATNFSVKADEKRTRTTITKKKGRTTRKQGDTRNPKGTFFRVKGKKVPARIWFGIPKNYKQKRNFDRFMRDIKRKLKTGDVIINQPLGKIKIG